MAYVSISKDFYRKFAFVENQMYDPLFYQRGWTPQGAG
jgi:hypothetical protein